MIKSQEKIQEVIKQALLDGASISEIKTVINRVIIDPNKAEELIESSRQFIEDEINTKYPNIESAQSITIARLEDLYQATNSVTTKLAILNKIATLLGLSDLEKAIDIVTAHGYSFVKGDAP